MTGPKLRPASSASAAPARPIPIRTVPRAALDAVVARLTAEGQAAAPLCEVRL